VRLGIVASRFNEAICGKLVDGARAEAQKLKAECTVISVPGALEIPLALQWMAQSGRFDALVALGAVIRGDTYHFELVANEAGRGVAEVIRATGVPCVFEVLATESVAQAEARAGGGHGNKGWEAAEVALRMANLLEELPGRPEAGMRGGAAR
jgi:6,7-dimethyl-8-ribityllumazine synthase